MYPFSLYDTNKDGYGDLKGISEKLHYLSGLGVETIWLTPIYESPMKDFGYDVSNYLGINPIFGTIEDFHHLVDTAHSLDIKIIMDFVPNHSSDLHEWFKKSEAGIIFQKIIIVQQHNSMLGESPYTDYYVWVDPAGWEGDTPVVPNNWLSKVRTSAWQWSDRRQQFYYHQYQPQQPDLNFRNR